MEFFTNIDLHFYFAICISICNGVMMCFVGYKFLQILQLAGYKMTGYVEWLKDTKGKYISRVLFLSLLSIAGVLVTNAVFDAYTSNKYLSYLGLVFYIYFSIVFIRNLYNAPKKTPLKYTRRMNRLTVCVGVLTSLTTFGLIAISTEYFALLRFGVVSVTPLLLIFEVPLAHYIMLPLEAIIRTIYIKRAKKVLKGMPNLIKIGITGSYGKTSCKYILNTMLKKKYSVCMSPHSFNTPMGITKVVLKYLKPFNEVLIAEMGATGVGDIRYLCNIVKPQYAILTSVGNQHLRTFKSIENIAKTKFELVEAVGKDGYAVFNGDNEGTMKMYSRATCEKTFISVDNFTAPVYASELKIDFNGMQFNINVNDKSYPCTTKLVGEHNLQDILMCVGLALKLGVDMESIVSAISELKAIPHRLELKRDNKDYVVLDDSFNSSVEGSESALKVLKLFEGQKIVVTPGIVELGGAEFEANKVLGKNISKVADKVIIVNHVHREAIKTGLIEGEYNMENVIEVDNLQAGILALNEIVEKGNCCVLLENDLPDNYT